MVRKLARKVFEKMTSTFEEICYPFLPMFGEHARNHNRLRLCDVTTDRTDIFPSANVFLVSRSDRIGYRSLEHIFCFITTRMLSDVSAKVVVFQSGAGTGKQSQPSQQPVVEWMNIRAQCYFQRQISSSHLSSLYKDSSGMV